MESVLGDGKFKAIPAGLIRNLQKGVFIMKGREARLLEKASEGKSIKEIISLADKYKILEENKETFDISGKIDTSNPIYPIYRFYESEVQKYLKKIRPEMKRIKDKQGVEWFEIPIKWEDKIKPIYAFKAGDVVAEPAYNISIKEAKKIWSKFFNEDEVKFIAKKQLPPDPQGRVVYGRYADALVEVVEKNGKIDDKVLYHEAFHAYVDLFVDEKTKKELFAEYSEEELADKFADYVSTKKAPTKKIERFFRELLAFIKKLIKKQDKVERLFDDILKKRRREVKKPTLVKRYKVGPEEEVPEEVLKEFKKAEEEILSQLAKKVKDLGGIKIAKDIEEEMREAVPINLLNKNGFTPDEMAKELNTLGYNFEDGYELLDQLRKVKGARIKITPKKEVKIEKIKVKKIENKLAADVEALGGLENPDIVKDLNEIGGYNFKSKEELLKALKTEKPRKTTSIEREVRELLKIYKVSPKTTRIKTIIKRATGLIPPRKIVKIEEKKLLKLRLRIQALGARFGKRAAMEEMREKISELREQHKQKIKTSEEIKEKLYQYAKKNLPPSERGKVLARLKNVKTEIGLKRAITYTQRVLEKYLAKQEIKKIVKDIQKIPTTGMSYDYKKKIEGIKAMFDLKRRTAKTIKRRQKLLEFILRESSLPMSREEFEQAMRENKDIPLSISTPVPRELIEDALRKPLNELNLEEVRALHKTLMNLAHLGRTKHRLLKIAEKREIKKQQNLLIQKLAKDINRIKEIEEKLQQIKITKEKSRKERVIYGIKKYYWQNIRPERILEKLDGYKTFGEWWRTFFQPIDKATDQEVEEYHKKEEELKQIFKDLKINTKKFFKGKREKINERIGKAGGLTPSEKIGVYLASLDEDKKRYLILKKNFTEQDIQDVVNALTPQEKALGDWLLSKYNDPKEWEEINKVHVLLFGTDMGKVKNYSRIFTKAMPGELSQDMANEMLERYRLRRAFVERGFTYERTKTALKDISLDAIADYLKHIQQVAHFKAFAPIVRDYNKILLDSDFREKVIDLIGEEAYVELVNYIKDVASKKQGRNWTSTEKFLLKRRAKAAPAMIGFNVLSWARQPVSILTAMAEGPVHTQYIIKGVKQYTANPKKITKFVEERSPQIKYRFVERVIREMEESKSIEKIVSGKTTLAEASVAGVRLSDKATVVAIWKGIYDMVKMGKVKGLKPTEENAIEYANYIIRKTQPTGYTKDLPSYFRAGPTEKMFTMFMNMANQSVNYQTHDIIGKVKAGERNLASGAWGIIFSVIISSFILGMIQRGRLPKDWKEIVIDLASYPLGGWFIVGGILKAGLSGYTEYGIAPLEFLNSLTKSVADLKRGKWEKALYALGQGVSMWSGIPWNQPYRTAKGVLDFIKGETSDLRRLIWSEWTLKEEKGGEGFILEKNLPTLYKRSTTIEKSLPIIEK